MDLLSSFAFLATAQKAAPVPESLEIKGLADSSQPFRALMQVPAGPGESAPELIGQRLVLPGDAGKALPPGGQSLPAVVVGGNEPEPVATEQRGVALPRIAPAPAFFGKDRIEAFAAPARRTDAPADVPDDWSGRADYIREQYVLLGPPARQVARPLPVADELPAAIDAKDSGVSLPGREPTGLTSAETRIEMATDSDAVTDADGFARPVPLLQGESSGQLSGSPEAASTDNHVAGTATDRSPGLGVSLDDFPRASAAVLPGETGRHPGPWLNATPLQQHGELARAEPIARTEAASSTDKAVESGAVPVLRRKVLIQTHDGGLDTRVELARTPASYSSAMAPVRPHETGDPTATHRAQALVDAMPRIRTHRRISADGVNDSVQRLADHATKSVVAGNSAEAERATGREIFPAANAASSPAPAAPGPMGPMPARPAMASDQPVNPMGANAVKASAELANQSREANDVKPLPDQAGSALPRDPLMRPADVAQPKQAPVSSPTTSGADNLLPAATPSKPAPGASPNTPAPAPQTAGNVNHAHPVAAGPQTDNKALAPDGPGQFAGNQAAAGEPGRRPQSVPTGVSASPAPVSIRAPEGQAAKSVRDGVQGAAQPELAARFAATLNKLEASAPARTPGFVTDKGAAVDVVRIATVDTSVGAITPSSAQSIASTDPAAPQFRLPASAGGEQWSQALGERVVLMLRGGQQAARLVLNPEHLGAIEVQVRVQDEQALVTLQAQSNQAREALENALPRLREMLAEQGLDLARDSGSGERRAQDRSEGNQRRESGASWQQAAADDSADAGQEGRRGGHDGLLDRYI